MVRVGWWVMAAALWACDGGDPDDKDTDDTEPVDTDTEAPDPDSEDSEPDTEDSEPDTEDSDDSEPDTEDSETDLETPDSTPDTFVAGETGPRDTYDTDIPIDVNPFDDTAAEVSLFGTGKARVANAEYHGWETWHFHRPAQNRDICVIRYDATDYDAHPNPPAGTAPIGVTCVNCEFQFSVILDNPRELTPAGNCAGLNLPQYANFPDHWNYGYGYGNGRFYYFYQSGQFWAPLGTVAPGDASFNPLTGRFRYKSILY